MKGVIQRVDSQAQNAVILAENGQSYTMRMDQWNGGGVSPQQGQNVEFMVAGSSAIEVDPDHYAPQQQPVNNWGNQNPNSAQQATQVAQNLTNGIQSGFNQGVNTVANAFNQLPQVQQQSRKPESSYGFLDWVIKALKSSLNFNGRSRRAEYVNFMLFYFGVLAASKILAISVGMLIGGNLLYYISALILLLPFVAVNTRRLHDLNCSGWVQLIMLLPLLNLCLIVFLMVKDSNGAPNKFGQPVKQVNFNS